MTLSGSAAGARAEPRLRAVRASEYRCQRHMRFLRGENLARATVERGSQVSMLGRKVATPLVSAHRSGRPGMMAAEAARIVGGPEPARQGEKSAGGCQI